MKRILILQVLFLAVAFNTSAQPVAPTNVVVFSGDKSVILHWDLDAVTQLTGYHVSRSLSSGGPFAQQKSGLGDVVGLLRSRRQRRADILLSSHRRERVLPDQSAFSDGVHHTESFSQ